MKREKLWMMIAFIVVTIGFMSCSKSDEETIGPEIKFAENIKETTARSGEVSVVITSSVGLKEVVVDMIVDNKIIEVIETATEFENPKRYTFASEFRVSDYTHIRFTAVDKDNQRSIDSYTFNPPAK